MNNVQNFDASAPEPAIQHYSVMRYHKISFEPAYSCMYFNDLPNS